MDAGFRFDGYLFVLFFKRLVADFTMRHMHFPTGNDKFYKDFSYIQERYHVINVIREI